MYESLQFLREIISKLAVTGLPEALLEFVYTTEKSCQQIAWI